ncbi:DUF262 domain-containing protein [Pseudomonas fluorescens]|uniref:DUF262 domain-containing protein n=1 Tax=Pseudomonas TaxID=286 RepID=UPI000F020D39|nr:MULTISPECIES: DUF262 domain-containing protein [Pseudomonas]MBD8088717.1 DUF262 domain-containing protein [Pseudomonas fluorescens]MBD8614822.1 DUF262 domain-containing protein [Pseudomonas putida]MBD8681494.1 DUF262 domain-containing protein [Pseudomonas sp. CFBP 13719]
MRVQQHSLFLASLLVGVIEGQVLPAGMQRPYVWVKSDVEAFFDSILQGFPVGAFLYWQPDQQANLSALGKKRLGPIVSAQACEFWNPRMLLLDGQNRLATVAWSLLNEEAPDLDYSDAERATWLSGQALVVDGATQSIVFVPKNEADKGLRLPAWTITGASDAVHGRAMRMMRERQTGAWKDFSEDEISSFIDFWDTASRAFQGARVVVTVIEDATPEQARHAFMRICRVGVAMSPEDFDKALQWAV